MESTTIAISRRLKEQLKEFGDKGESYSEILARLVRNAKARQLHDLLMNEEDTITIDEALANAKKRWRR